METGRRAPAGRRLLEGVALPQEMGQSYLGARQLVQESRDSTASSTEAKEKDASRKTNLAGLIEVQGRWKREEPQSSQLRDETCVYPAREAPRRLWTEGGSHVSEVQADGWVEKGLGQVSAGTGQGPFGRFCFEV